MPRCPAAPGSSHFSCQRRLPLLSNPRIAGEFIGSLARLRAEARFDLFAWVVMPEHVHLLLRPAIDGPTVEAILRRLKMSVTRRVLNRWQLIGASRMLERIDDGHGKPRFWQKGGGFDRNVRTLGEFCREVRYVHRNPVERSLVNEPGEWRWSSVHDWMGEADCDLACDPPPPPIRKGPWAWENR